MEPESSKENHPLVAIQCLLCCLGVGQPLGISVASCLLTIQGDATDLWHQPSTVDDAVLEISDGRRPLQI